MKDRALRGLFYVAIIVLISWLAFTVGYYFAFTRAEMQTVALMSGDVRTMKFTVEQIKSGNTTKAIDVLQGMADVKEASIETTYVVLHKMPAYYFSVHPVETLGILLSEPAGNMKEMQSDER